MANAIFSLGLENQVLIYNQRNLVIKIKDNVKKNTEFSISKIVSRNKKLHMFQEFGIGVMAHTINLANWEAKIRKITVQGQPRKK
jgi:hypothetical protein